MTEINFFDLFLKANLLIKIIVLILIGCSIFSWAIIIYRTRILNAAKRDAANFEEKFWSGIELSTLYKNSHNRQYEINGSEQIFYYGFKEFTRLYRSHTQQILSVSIEGATRVMRISINREIEALESYMPFLGTIGYISPYIGLLGTVWGIMHAFLALGNIKQATLQMVAPGIAEALIATGCGLFAAIPAVISYNILSHYLSKLEQNYDNFMEEFIAILHRQIFLKDIQK